MTVRGVLQVHSAPPALSPHIEWAVAGVLGVPVVLPWVDQPAAPGTVRAELDWQGPAGTAGAITSELAHWGLLRFEATEEASPGCDAVRYSCTPDLGVFAAMTSASGDIVVPEARLRAAMTLAAASRRGPRQPAGPADSEDEVAGHAAGGEVRELPAAGSQQRIRHPALGGSLEAELRMLLGQSWDEELEPFRHAAEGAPVRWLHATG
ncbi:MAG TPA: DUF3145 domain-containing protein [Streptosporangiaceae bacterium]